MPMARKDKNNAFSANRKIIQDFYGYFSTNGKPTNIIYYPLKSPETQQMFKDQLTNRKFGLKFKSLLTETTDKLFDKKYKYNDYSNIPNYQWFVTKNNKDFFVFHILTLGEYNGKVVYYYALTITPCDKDGQQTAGAYTLVEVINDCDNVSEDKFYNNVKQALSKVNLNNKKRISVVASTFRDRKFKFSDGSIITASCAEEAKQKHKVMAAKPKKETKIPEEIQEDVEYFVNSINKSPLFTKAEIEDNEDIYGNQVPTIGFDVSFGISVDMGDGDKVYHCMQFSVGPYKENKKYGWEVFPDLRGAAIWPKVKAHHFSNAKDAFNYCVLCAKEYKKCVDAYQKFVATVKEASKNLK